MRSHTEFVLKEFRERLLELQEPERVRLLDQTVGYLLDMENWKKKVDQPEEAFSRGEALILLANEIGSPEGEARVRIRYANTLLGEVLGSREIFVDQAVEHFESSLAIGESLGLPTVMAESLLGLSLCAERKGDFEKAYRLLLQLNKKNGMKLVNDPSMEIRDDFLAMISHEVRTPMNGIVGMSELLSRMKLNGEVKELVDVIHECGLTLSTLLDDFLDSNHFMESNIELRLELLDVSGLFNRTIRMFSLRRKPGVEFRFEWDDSVHTSIWGDPSRIRQILNNLLTNAFKFTDEGFVGYRVYNRDARAVVFEIEDSGRGIPADEIQVLLGDELDGKQVGSGIGLAMCRKLARLMKGDLGYRIREGGGSVFTLVLPTPNAALESGDVVSKAIERVSRVLVVEDTELNWKVIQMMLGNLGVHADWAAGGSEALVLFERGPYDLIFMDFQMDDMDGPETTKRIRSLVTRLGCHSPYIVALTADSTAANRLVELSMDDFLGKPVRVEVLEGVINRFRSWSTRGEE